jgi:hypothetical protein
VAVSLARTAKQKPYSEDEKALVAYLKEKLTGRGVKKYPRDWHLKQLAVARRMLAGPSAPGLEQWKACIDWLFEHQFWGDKVDHLARVEDKWVQFALQNRRQFKTDDQESNRRKELIKKLYLQ